MKSQILERLKYPKLSVNLETVCMATQVGRDGHKKYVTLCILGSSPCPRGMSHLAPMSSESAGLPAGETTKAEWALSFIQEIERTLKRKSDVSGLAARG